MDRMANWCIGGCWFTLALLMHNIYLEILATGLNARRTCNQMLVHYIFWVHRRSQLKRSNHWILEQYSPWAGSAARCLINIFFSHLLSAVKPITFYYLGTILNNKANVLESFFQIFGPNSR
jgi:hypothetical protein